MYHLIISEINLKKKRKKFNIVASVFENAGVEYELHATKTREELRGIISTLTSQRDNSIIVLGGD